MKIIIDTEPTPSVAAVKTVTVDEESAAAVPDSQDDAERQMDGQRAMELLGSLEETYRAPLALNPGKWMMKVEAYAPDGTRFFQRLDLFVKG